MNKNKNEGKMKKNEDKRREKNEDEWRGKSKMLKDDDKEYMYNIPTPKTAMVLISSGSDRIGIYIIYDFISLGSLWSSRGYTLAAEVREKRKINHYSSWEYRGIRVEVDARGV